MKKPSSNSNELAIRQRYKDDYPYYSENCLKIRKKTGKLETFKLNRVQLHIHEIMQQQLAEIGMVRCLILKGRQQGCSTLIEGRFYWKASHSFGMRVYILTHVDEATNNLFKIAKRYHEHCPPGVRPLTGATNRKELVFSKLDSSYGVGTAGGHGTGRSDTIQLFHGSEVAYWTNADDHLKGALQAVALMPGTEVVLESTSNGPQGVFYDMCMAAHRGEGIYKLIFIPWFWSDEYRLPCPEGFTLTKDEEEYARLYQLDNEQMMWRRNKIVELHGVWNFRREYPATVDEAFKAEVIGALWKRPLIEKYRLHPDLLVPLKRIVIAIDPSGGESVDNDEQGIVAAGLGEDNRVYVLADRSGHYTPNGWGMEAVALYKKLNADRIIGEANYGGNMVEHVVRTIDPNVPYKSVSAMRSKQLRAEPVAALYEQGMVSHVGDFPMLEDEMTTWSPTDSKDSPNRVDALVWAITELKFGQEERWFA